MTRGTGDHPDLRRPYRRPGELDGAPISSTAGHLLVIVGFREDGGVVVDPAARNDRGVRRTYDRGQFEDVWLPASDGMVYVITDADHPLPGGTSGLVRLTPRR